MAPTDDWELVQTIFAGALERDPADRARWLDVACANQPLVRARVDALMRSHQEAGDFLALDPPASGGAPDFTGLHIGPFALVREIGRGGMSVVYLADRVDGGFAQQVAVKIIDAPVRHDDVRSRFHAERQILARFAHPNIVSLLDAGVTADDRPYLVMELVVGRSLTVYCAEERIDLPGRLALLGQLCRAVQYAHQHGVVHRDLKPANVLVTGDGMVKVLDFGIAKLLDDSILPDVDRTQAGAQRALTPGYASPEQLRGGTVTTAADIYALGVLMYEVLTGRRPYETRSLTLHEIVTLITETPLPRPSVAGGDQLPYPRAALGGDLDAIVRKAMAAAPEDRYASAQQLADDLTRSLNHEPVEARRVSMAYVLSRLARRHRAAVVASTVSLVALVAALGVSLWQMRTARLERDRAEQRFDDARQLANAMIFKVDDAVRPLPGATPVRQLIVSEALKYLERLSQDPSADDVLRLELARGYHRVADVQGRPSAANLGDRAGAESSYQKAVALLRPIVTGPVARDAALERGRIQISIATLRGVNQYDAAAAAAVDEARSIGDQLLAANPGDEEAERLLASVHFQRAMNSPRDARLAEWTRTAELYEALLRRQPDDGDRQRNVALVEKYIGTHYEQESNFAAALPHFMRALEMDQRRLVRQPSRATKFDVAVDLSSVATSESQLNQADAALAHLAACLQIREELASSDPKDVLAQDRLALTHRVRGQVYRDHGRVQDALREFRTAVEIHGRLASVDAHARNELSVDLWMRADAEQRLGQKQEACRDAREALTLVDALLAEKALPDVTDAIQKRRAQIVSRLATCGPAR